MQPGKSPRLSVLESILSVWSLAIRTESRTWKEAGLAKYASQSGHVSDFSCLSLLVRICTQVLVIVGCGGSLAKTNSPGSGSVSGSGGGSGSGSVTGCSGSGYGYDNTNGTITGVWLQSPSPGQNPSHVQVNAIAYSSSAVTQWMICLDDQSVYQTNNVTSSISQGIDMTTGQHLLYARVWDAQGDSDRSEVELIQVGPPPPSSTVLPTPPADVQVLTEMQNDTSNWSICSLCAHGTNTTGNYWMAPFQSQPSLSGSSLEMYADGPSWTNVLFMDTMLGTSSNSHFCGTSGSTTTPLPKPTSGPRSSISGRFSGATNS
jgi:hypothetical protein